MQRLSLLPSLALAVLACVALVSPTPVTASRLHHLLRVQSGGWGSESDEWSGGGGAHAAAPTAAVSHDDMAMAADDGLHFASALRAAMRRRDQMQHGPPYLRSFDAGGGAGSNMLDAESDLMRQQNLLESASEERLGIEAAAASAYHSAPDPTRFESSADYMQAMNSAEEAENFTPQQMQAFQAHLLSEHGQEEARDHHISLAALAAHAPAPREAAPLPGQQPRRSLADIDNLIGDASAASSLSSYAPFNPAQLRSPSLQHDLSQLQDEESIQTAMLHTQAKIKAIAAELERHQQLNGPDHSPGIEIEIDEGDFNNLHSFQPTPTPTAHHA